ncbi:MAG: hypothetical protein J5J00_12810 [Deltaproteobacteria bacterium]|nr:hypothetical protein [Deltaproteobacteria bacterium]
MKQSAAVKAQALERSKVAREFLEFSVSSAVAVAAIILALAGIARLLALIIA